MCRYDWDQFLEVNQIFIHSYVVEKRFRSSSILLQMHELQTAQHGIFYLTRIQELKIPSLRDVYFSASYVFMTFPIPKSIPALSPKTAGPSGPSRPVEIRLRYVCTCVYDANSNKSSGARRSSEGEHHGTWLELLDAYSCILQEPWASMAMVPGSNISTQSQKWNDISWFHWKDGEVWLKTDLLNEMAQSSLIVYDQFNECWEKMVPVVLSDWTTWRVWRRGFSPFSMLRTCQLDLLRRRENDVGKE